MSVLKLENFSVVSRRTADAKSISIRESGVEVDYVLLPSNKTDVWKYSKNLEEDLEIERSMKISRAVKFEEGTQRYVERGKFYRKIVVKTRISQGWGFLPGPFRGHRLWQTFN